MEQQPNEKPTAEQKHGKNKKTIKIIGICLLCVGVACIVAGFVNLIVSTGKGEFPDLFFLLIIGFPTLAFGGMFTIAGFRKEIATYIKNEDVPVFNELGQQVKPGISAIADAVKNSDVPAVCKKCGAQNAADSRFCKKCGEPLVRICPKCGESSGTDSAFCDKCGAKLD